MLRPRAFDVSWGSTERMVRGAGSHVPTFGVPWREAGNALVLPARLRLSLKRGLWIAFLWLSSATSVSAQPQPLPLELVWKAPAECPSAAEVRSELARIARVRSGYSLLPLAADAHVTRARDGFRVALRTQHEGRRGERTLAAADCHTLARSVTLVLALAFGPGVELEPATPPSQPSAAAATPLSAPARDKPDSASNERGEERPNAGRPSADENAARDAGRSNAPRAAGRPSEGQNARDAGRSNAPRAAGRPSAAENAARDAGRSNAPRAAGRPSEGQNARDAGRSNAPRAAGRPSAARENASRNVREDAPRSDATLGAGDSASRSAAGDNAARNVGENAPSDSGGASSGEAALRDGDPGGVPLLAAHSAEPLPSRDALRLALVLHASGALRLAPAFSFAAAVGVQLKLGAYAVEARALLVPTARFDITAAIRGQLRALGGSLALCRLDDIADSFELSTCAGARLVSLTVRSTGELERASATAPWTALTAAAYLGWPRRYWLQLRVEAAISLALSRPRFVIESLGDVHRVGLLVPELGLSLAAGL